MAKVEFFEHTKKRRNLTVKLFFLQNFKLL